MRPVAVPLLATCPSHTRLSHMATSPPPLAPSRLCCRPPLAARPHRRPSCSCAPSCTAMVLPPSQPHMSPPLCHLHGPRRSMPCSRTHYTAAPIAAVHAASPPSQPHSVAMHPAAAWAASVPPSQLRRPRCPLPRSWAHHIIACLVAGWATSAPPLQLHTLRRHVPCSCTGHLPPPLQLYMPHRRAPYSWTGHVAASFLSSACGKSYIIKAVFKNFVLSNRIP
jgi:hypothetical protein